MGKALVTALPLHTINNNMNNNNINSFPVTPRDVDNVSAVVEEYHSPEKVKNRIDLTKYKKHDVYMSGNIKLLTTSIKNRKKHIYNHQVNVTCTGYVTPYINKKKKHHKNLLMFNKKKLN